MLEDVKVFDGVEREWTELILDNNAKEQYQRREALLERSSEIPFWIAFSFRGRLYYKTFEDHIYRVEALAARTSS